MGGPTVCKNLAWSGSSDVTYDVYCNSTNPVQIDAGHLVTSGIPETNYTNCARPIKRGPCIAPERRGALRLRHGADAAGA